jgi:hypothetical protein
MFRAEPSGGQAVQCKSPHAELADAIRVGCKLRPRQIYGNYLRDNISGACALGAAMAVSQPIPPLPNKRKAYIMRRFPILMSTNALHPERHDDFCCAQSSLRDIIMDLNDSFHWSRERIADWVESLGAG